MKNIINVIVLSIGLAIGTPALADSQTDVFARCMVDNLNGKERTNLSKWIFFSIAAHPEIKSYSSVGQKEIKVSDEYVGKLITRLLTSDCPNELKRAHKSDPMAVQTAFGLVGKVAMQELMTNQDVMKALTNYAQYADKDKLNKLLSEK